MTAAPALTLDGFHPEFAGLAAAMADDRARGYPAMVEAGTITQAQANRRIFLMRAIAELWASAGDVHRMPNKAFLSLTRDEAVAELDNAIDGAERRARRRPADPAAQLLVERLHAMRWWHAHYPPRAYAHNFFLNLRADADQRAIEREKAAA